MSEFLQILNPLIYFTDLKWYTINMGQETAQKYCYVKESQVIQIHCLRNHTLAKCIYKMLIKILCVNTTHMHTDKHIHTNTQRHSVCHMYTGRNIVHSTTMISSSEKICFTWLIFVLEDTTCCLRQQTWCYLWAPIIQNSMSLL